LEGTSALGTISLVTNNVISVSGFELTSAIGSVTATGAVNVVPTGVSATGLVGGALVWGKIIPGQDSSWQNVDDSQTPSWSNVDDSQTPSWEEVA